MNNQRLKGKLCSWCGHKGVAGDGNGVFRDVDVDISTRGYPGIPVCGGCGGLGVEYDTEDFKRRMERIMKLRFEFHPIDNFPDPPDIILYQTLKSLLEEVKELTEKYGCGNEKSFARTLLSGSYDKVLSFLKEEAAKILEELEHDEAPTPEAELERPALKAFYSGDLEKGEKLFKELLKSHPENSMIMHDFGAMLIKFKRDPERALRYFIEATKLNPKKALHFHQVARTLVLLGREDEAQKYFVEATQQPDFEEFNGE